MRPVVERIIIIRAKPIRTVYNKTLDFWDLIDTIKVRLTVTDPHCKRNRHRHVDWQACRQIAEAAACKETNRLASMYTHNLAGVYTVTRMQTVAESADAKFETRKRRSHIGRRSTNAMEEHGERNNIICLFLTIATITSRNRNESYRNRNLGISIEQH